MDAEEFTLGVGETVFQVTPVQLELTAYGIPTKPPTVERIANTISGIVIVAGDSCGLKSAGIP